VHTSVPLSRTDHLYQQMVATSRPFYMHIRMHILYPHKHSRSRASLGPNINAFRTPVRRAHATTKLPFFLP